MPQEAHHPVDILGFEFEMGLFPNVLDEARAKGIDIAPKYIPAEVFDKRAVEKNQVVFHDVASIEVKPHVKGQARVAVELTDFSVFYSQDSIANAEATLKDKGSKIVVEKGQIVKVSKDKDGIVTREVLTKNWTDWIDYWAVDFNFESKREIIRVQERRERRMGRALDRGLHLRERVADLPHQEGPLAGADERLPRMPAGAAQDGGQGGGHLRQRHHDDCGGERGREEIMALHPDFPESPARHSRPGHPLVSGR